MVASGELGRFRAGYLPRTCLRPVSWSLGSIEKGVAFSLLLTLSLSRSETALSVSFASTDCDIADDPVLTSSCFFFRAAARAASFDGLDDPPKRRPRGSNGSTVISPNRLEGRLPQGVSQKKSRAETGKESMTAGTGNGDGRVSAEPLDALILGQDCSAIVLKALAKAFVSDCSAVHDVANIVLRCD